VTRFGDEEDGHGSDDGTDDRETEARSQGASRRGAGVLRRHRARSDTVHDATYQPLSRPLFIYVKVESARRPEVRSLVRAYLDPATTQIVKRIGYMPLPLGTTLRVGQRFEDGTVGSVFGGRGAIVGITADVFRDEDKIKSALVR
jgi:hypothetical protein